MRYIAFLIIIITSALVVLSLSRTPPYTPGTKAFKRKVVGEPSLVQSSSLLRAASSIILLRKPFPSYIVNVPLTPFKAPLKTIPASLSIPSFLVYKQKYLSPIRNQGECGSCFVFATCDMLTDRLAILSRGDIQTSLSVQQIMSCYDKTSCDGGSPEELAQWIAESGNLFVSNSLSPYVQKKGGTVDTKCIVPLTTRDIRVGIEPNSVKSLVEFIPEGETSPINVSRMKAELVNEGPFYCAMTVYDDLFTYSGLKPYTPNPHAQQIGGHAIEIIGYSDPGVDPRKGFEKGYWICRNSWSKDWPLQSALEGYFTVEMGKNTCGIESRCGSATPKVVNASVSVSPVLSIDDLRFTDIHSYLAPLQN
jgi:C1A family cysteine protease